MALIFYTQNVKSNPTQQFKNNCEQKRANQNLKYFLMCFTRGATDTTAQLRNCQKNYN